ncbi:MAG: signal peptidase I [Ruminococcus sp.]|nr:signal peptidase I [Ruminococcus sp.]
MADKKINKKTETSSEITEQTEKPLRKKFRIRLKHIITAFLSLVAVAVLCSAFFLPVIQVSGDSMEPLLSNGDIVLLYKTDVFERGSLCCVSWKNKLMLKRVIGLSGDVINIDKDGNVYVNDEFLEEPYVMDKALGECDITLPYTVEEGEIFFLGDHRETSIDSRLSAVGCIEEKQVVGRVLVKLWSIEPEN